MSPDARDRETDDLAADIDARRARVEAAPEFPHAYVDRVRSAAQRLSAVEIKPDDVRAAVALAEQHTTIDVDVPTASQRPATGVIKRVVKRVVLWYLRYLANQITLLGQALVRVGQATAARLEHVEQRVDDLEARLRRLEEKDAG